MKLGLDVGASKSLAVLYSEGEIKKSEKKQTSKKDTLSFLLGFAKSLKGENEISSVGLSVAGTLEPESGEIYGAGNLKSLPGMPVKKKFEEEFEAPVYLDNDGACFIWAEFLKGAAKDKSIALGVTLGTGVGGGAVLDYLGEPFLFHGAFNSAFEVGHMTIKEGGRKCGCGARGCLEAYASSNFFKEYKRTPLEIQKAAEEGEKEAKEIYQDYGYWLGIGLANLVNIYDPEVIVLGGGLSRALHLYKDKLEEEIQNHVLSSKSRKEVEIKKAQLGYRAPAIGAALLDKA